MNECIVKTSLRAFSTVSEILIQIIIFGKTNILIEITKKIEKWFDIVN